MITVRTAAEARWVCSNWRSAGETLGFVPTMGALHEGHLSLARVARGRCDRVVVSIFVNPLQFGPAEDFGCYPRPLEADTALLEQEGVDLLFVPEASEVYPAGFSTWIEVEGVSAGLCGEFRPGHFKGVATVCCILLSIIRPHVAVFGQKDAQQLAVVRRVVQDLRLNMEIVGAPTIREADGLALSSRNSYLSSAERVEAPAIYRGLCRAARLAKSCPGVPVQALRDAFSEEIEGRPLLRLQYIDLVDPSTIAPMPVLDRRGLFAAAVLAGTTRLIDNVLLEPGTGAVEVETC
jgi:pantoate--beta-alanine ligase